MTRFELENLVEAYSTRTDLRALIESSFRELAEARIGRDLETQENEAEVTLTPTASPFAAPADFGKLIALEYLEDRGPRTLLSRDVRTINYYNQTGGTPRAFYMRQKRFDVRPFVAGSYRVTYYQRPELPSASSTNGVLDRYPNIYLYAMLVELHVFERDVARLNTALGAYQLDVQAANKDARRAQSNKPAMRRA